MNWTIVTKREISKFGNLNEHNLRDEWYEFALALIKHHTGWGEFVVSEVHTDVLDGNDSATLRVHNPPIQSVSSVSVNGTILPPAIYSHRDTHIYFKNILDIADYDIVSNNPYFLETRVFPLGLGNIIVTYTSGGTSTNRYNLVRTAMVMIIKELATVSSNQGTDAALQAFRPDRTLLPEEVLMEYGLHGKIKGILNTLLPRKVLIA